MGVWFKGKQRSDLDQLLPSLQHWFDGESGRELIRQQRELLDKRLAFVFGYHCVHIGLEADARLLAGCRIGHRVSINPSPHSKSTENQLRCSYTQWPIADRSLDAVVMHHPLDFCLEPQQLLREAARSVIPGGKIIVIGFNPYSLFTLLNSLFPGRRRPISEGRYISPHRIQDWLKLLGYSIDEVCYGPFMPAMKPSLPSRLGNKLRDIGRRWKLPFGSFYMIVATREDAALTPTPLRWRVRRKRLAGGVAVERSSRRG